LDFNRIFILDSQFFSQALLGVLKLSRLGIVAFLPGQLSDEAVAQPNEQSAGIVAIFDISSIFEHITAPKVSVHQSP